MARSYDVVSKRLIDIHPSDWLTLLGLPRAEVETLDIDVLDSDLSTITSQADRILRIVSTEPTDLQHIELVTGHHGIETARALELYNLLIDRKYGQPVRSTVILLREEADSRRLTGQLTRSYHNNHVYRSFEYQVVRVWELPVEDLLAGGVGTLPLAPLANVRESQLPDVIRQMESRLQAETINQEEEGEFWTATQFLMGLRYSPVLADHVIRGVRKMRESSTYQAVLQEGRMESEAMWRAAEAQRILLQLGGRRLGNPSDAVIQAITSIDSVARLEQLADRLFDVKTWDEMLAV